MNVKMSGGAMFRLLRIRKMMMFRCKQKQIKKSCYQKKCEELIRKSKIN